MTKAFWLRFATSLGMVVGTLGQAAVGQDNANPVKAQNVAGEKEQLVQEFATFKAEIEAEIARREEAIEQGGALLEAYRAELTSEYVANVDRLKQDSSGEPPELDEPALEKRQKVIGLYIWELERLEPFVKAKLIPSKDLVEKIRERMNEVQQVRRGDGSATNLRSRYQVLYQKVASLEHRRNQNRQLQLRGARGGFYEVQLPSTSELKDKGNGIDAAGLEPPFGSSAIQQIRLPLRRILKLQWTGASLALDHNHWDALFVGKTLEQVGAEVRRGLEERGLDVLYDPNQGRHLAAIPAQDNLFLLFQNLRHAAHQGKQTSTGRSSNGTSWQQTFNTSQLGITMTWNQGSFDLDLREINPPRRQIRVYSRNDNTLRISLLGDRMLYLDQKSNGKVRLLEVYEDEVLHVKGDSFVGVYSKYPDFVESSVFPLLEYLGFVLPESRFSSRIVGRVVELARAMSSDHAEEFNGILEDLNSESFQTREMAERTLREQVDSYIDLAKNAYRDKSLSLEVRSRLKRLLHVYEKESGQLDEFIAGMKMLDDPQYLADLLAKLPEEDVSAVRHRLEQLAGK